MRPIRKVSVTLAALGLMMFGIGQTTAQAAEVLGNIGLEESAGPEGWTLTQTITGEPGVFAPVTEHLGAANEPMSVEGELGLLVKPFAGNVGAFQDQNKMVNASLSQTFNFGPSAAGRTYTFTGHSFFQIAASNNIDTLFPDSPSGAVPSPTETFFELAFLDASDNVLDTPVRLDLPKNRTTDVRPDDWQLHEVMGMAPAGTTKIRVTAAATDMVASCTTDCPAGQDVNFDNFSLRDATAPGIERLTNANLNTLGAPAGWEIEKTAQDNISFAGNPSFAAHTGNVGMWLRSFAGGDAKILQTVPGAEGEEYTFAAWSKWETGYNGADPLSNTQTFMTLEFLDASEAVIGSPVSLDLRTVQFNDGEWRELTVPTSTAPAGTASVRVSAGATGMDNSTIDPQSAFFDDFSLMTSAIVGLLGDYNENGAVDAADYVVWRDNENTTNTLPNDGGLGGTIGQAHYDLWAANFGETSSGANLLATSSAAVPEPSAVMLIGIALGVVGAARFRVR